VDLPSALASWHSRPRRERVYEWMARWMKDGRPRLKKNRSTRSPTRLLATATGQVDPGSGDV
jgi:hypothetical protein